MTLCVQKFDTKNVEIINNIMILYYNIVLYIK